MRCRIFFFLDRDVAHNATLVVVLEGLHEQGMVTDDMANGIECVRLCGIPVP